MWIFIRNTLFFEYIMINNGVRLKRDEVKLLYEANVPSR